MEGDLDTYYVTKNHNQEEYEHNQKTTSEMINPYFQNFNSSIFKEKSVINPTIDDFSENRYYVKKIRSDVNVYEDLYNKYTNEGVINGGQFMNNITGIQENYNHDLSKF